MLTGGESGQLVSAIAAVLGVPESKAAAITGAFERHVAQPLAANLSRLSGHDLPKRNPMIYTARGTATVSDWVSRS